MTPSVSSLKEEVWAHFMWILFIPKLRLLTTALSLFSRYSEEQRLLYAAFCARTVSFKNTYLPWCVDKNTRHQKWPQNITNTRCPESLCAGIYCLSQSVWRKSKSSCLSSMPGHHREAGGQLFMIITYSAQRAQHQEWSDATTSPCLCLHSLRQPVPLCILWPTLNYLNIVCCHKTDTVLLHVFMTHHIALETPPQWEGEGWWCCKNGCWARSLSDKNNPAHLRDWWNTL